MPQEDDAALARLALWRTRRSAGRDFHRHRRLGASIQG
jgi:hypothetical protein